MADAGANVAIDGNSSHQSRAGDARAELSLLLPYLPGDTQLVLQDGRVLKAPGDQCAFANEPHSGHVALPMHRTVPIYC